MSKYKIKTWLIIFAIVIVTLFLARPLLEKGFNWLPAIGKEYSIDIVDDSGFRIRLERPADRIISLYSAHTENLFSLGLDREIIGVGTSSIYPYQARNKEVFDYRSDPEKVIAANPQIVIIRPFIERHSPDFVDSLKRAGITVVSLYPDNFEEFDDYILKLATLTGKVPKAEQLLADFHAELDQLAAQTADIAAQDRVGVYFESSDIEYKTVTPLSMAAHAIEYAGGINVAADAQPIEEGSSIAVYGIENIVKKADEIDVYVTQRGVMGAGGNWHSISIRPGFDVIKAIKDHRVVEINQKIISSPTFRFIKGVKALQRAFYPEIFCKIDYGKGEITRAELSEVLVKHMRYMIFVPTRSYYRDENRQHYYGNLVDVPIDHPRFDYIETALKKSYFKSTIIDEEEYFYPDQPVSRSEFATILFLINELPIEAVAISDIDQIENKRVIEAVVSAGLMELDDGKFYPDQFITWQDVEKGLSNDQYRSID